jgi:hypothetical protein
MDVEFEGDGVGASLRRCRGVVAILGNFAAEDWRCSGNPNRLSERTKDFLNFTEFFDFTVLRIHFGDSLGFYCRFETGEEIILLLVQRRLNVLAWV